MPTIHQLIKHKRKSVKAKKKGVALHYGFNTLKNRPSVYPSPFKRGVCIKVFTQTPRKPNSALRKVKIKISTCWEEEKFIDNFLALQMN